MPNSWNIHYLWNFANYRFPHVECVHDTTRDCISENSSDSALSERSENEVITLSRPKYLFHLASFEFYKIAYIGRRAILITTLVTSKTNFCCIF